MQKLASEIDSDIKATVMSTYDMIIKRSNAEGEARGEAKVILALMEQFPDWSDEKIAQIAKVKLSFVQALRKQLNDDKK